MGIASIVYGDWVGDELSRLIIAPVALCCMTLFVANKTGLFLLLMGTSKNGAFLSRMAIDS
jgi:hypothetical protein